MSVQIRGPEVAGSSEILPGSVGVRWRMGKDATLFHFATGDDDDSMATQYVTQARLWFDSICKTIAREYEV